MCVLLLAAASHSPTIAQDIMLPDPVYHNVYLPPESADIKLLGSSTVPFGRFFSGFRYQQIYDASLFTNTVPKGGGFLWRIFFRPGCGGKQAASLTNRTIRMSTTSRLVRELSDRFDDNPGNDAMVVRSTERSGFNGSHASCRINPPEEGGFLTPYVAALTTPFFYDPSKGNLLMEISCSGSSPTAGLDPAVFQILGETTPADEGTIASIAGAGADAVVAEVRQPFGLVTRFVVAPFPRIHVTAAAASVFLSWNSNPGPAQLQERDSLDADSIWRPFSGPQAVQQGELTTHLELPRSALITRKYYRLFWNSPQVGLPDTPIEVNPDAFP